jgi:hypothetical protein
MRRAVAVRAVAVRAAGGAGRRRKLEEKGSQSVIQNFSFPHQLKTQTKISLTQNLYD